MKKLNILCILTSIALQAICILLLANNIWYWELILIFFCYLLLWNIYLLSQTLYYKHLWYFYGVFVWIWSLTLFILLLARFILARQPSDLFFVAIPFWIWLLVDLAFKALFLRKKQSDTSDKKDILIWLFIILLIIIWIVLIARIINYSAIKANNWGLLLDIIKLLFK